MKRKYFVIPVFIVCLWHTSTAQTSNLLWAKQTEATGGELLGSSTEVGYAIALDVNGNVYTTGYFSGTADFDPSCTGTYNLTAVGHRDIFVSKQDASGNFIWAKQMGGVEHESGLALVISSLGNVFITGRFQVTVDFDPGSSVYNLTSFGANDVFICKLNTDGNFIWAKQIGGIGDEFGQSITLDGNENVYTAGRFFGTTPTDFDPGPGDYEFGFSNTMLDIFVSKLDAGGNFLWAKKMAGEDLDEAYSIAVDNSGNVYTTGYFGRNVDFDPGPAEFILSAQGAGIFISKLDSSGNFIWAKKMGPAVDQGGGEGYAICTDNYGNVYTTGRFYSTVDFDPGPNTYNLTAVNSDIFVLKLDSQGNLVWVKKLGGPGNDAGKAIITDDNGNVYTTGFFYTGGNSDFDPGAGVFNLSSSGEWDIFISKLDPAGNFAWAKKIGGPSTEEALSIAVSPSANVYITGYFMGTVDFDPGQDVVNLISAGPFDIFIAEFGAGNPVAQTKYYRDFDGDGYGNPSLSFVACEAPAGYVSNGNDCNDANSGVHPGAVEICNRIDDNCDGIIDEGLLITPAVNITASQAGTICTGGGLVTFTATTTNTGGGSRAYSFKVNGNIVQNGFSNTFSTATLANGDTVNCVLSLFHGGCLTTNYATSNTITHVFSLVTATCSNNNPVLYYGYAGDQTATVQAVPAGGVAPYSVSISMNRPLNCNIITSTGDEIWSASSGTTVNGNCPAQGAGLTPISTGIVSTSGGAYSVNVTLMQDAVLTATITDAAGCTAICTTTIYAEDVRCFAGNNGNSKVLLCHKTGNLNNPCTNICVPESAVGAHLAHGDFLGSCTYNCIPNEYSFNLPVHAAELMTKSCDILRVKAWPNPSHSQFTMSVESTSDEKIEMSLYDVYGRKIKSLEKKLDHQVIFGAELKPGIYIAEIIQGANKKTIKLVKL